MTGIVLASGKRHTDIYLASSQRPSISQKHSSSCFPFNQNTVQHTVLEIYIYTTTIKAIDVRYKLIYILQDGAPLPLVYLKVPKISLIFKI